MAQVASVGFTPRESVEDKAYRALLLDKQIKTLQGQLENLKDQLKDKVPTKGRKFEFEGVGVVQITAQTLKQKTGNAPSFDKTKYEDLPQSLKNKLLQAGVITMTPTYTGGGPVQVRFQHNV